MKKVIVIGSKPKIKIPNFKFQKIYTANGAAERGFKLHSKIEKSELIAVVGGREYLGNPLVKKKIIIARPKKVYVRGAHLCEKDFYPLRCKIKNTWNHGQLQFQKNFFSFGYFSIFLAEFFYKKNFYEKIIHIIKSLKNNNFWGISSGFYAILLALHENPKSDIFVVGIGMSGGKQYYKNKRNQLLDYTPRSRVDRYLIKRLKKKYKIRILTNDVELASLLNRRYQCNRFE
tara:strand:+ start:28702 stop:29394 length:693 start_codon:yes stop_codon:yes gene_type:complete